MEQHLHIKSCLSSRLGRCRALTFFNKILLLKIFLVKELHVSSMLAIFAEYLEHPKRFDLIDIQNIHETYNSTIYSLLLHSLADPKCIRTEKVCAGKTSSNHKHPSI